MDKVQCSFPADWQSIVIEGANIRSTQLRTHFKRIAKSRKTSNLQPVVLGGNQKLPRRINRSLGSKIDS